MAIAPWLPPPVPGEIAERLDCVAQEWSARWFGRGGHGRVQACRPAEQGEWTWLGDAGCAVGAGSGRLVSLGLAALAGEADPDNARDRELLEKIGGLALEDLAGALARAVGVSPNRAACAPLDPEAELYVFYPTGDVFLAFAVNPVAQARLRQQAAGHRDAPALGRLGAAIAPERVTLGCHLGAARLSAAELIGLAPGDLVVLDRAADGRLPLTVNDAFVARGAAAFDFGADPPAVRITEPLELSLGIS